jgi:hypothetical protein
MASNIIRSLVNSNPYKLVNTADKQEGDEAIQLWLDANKIEPGLHEWSTPQIERFVKDFIKELPKGQITNENIGSVEQRFRELSQASCRARSYLIDANLEKIDRKFQVVLISIAFNSCPNKL